MKGGDFVSLFSRKGLPAWEAAALALARQNLLTPWPFVDLPLSDGQDTLVLKVASDVLSVGPFEDHVRLPLTPQTAQSIANLSGSLLTTPLLEYRIWQAARAKLQPTAIVPNRGADLEQYAQHSRAISDQLSALSSRPGDLTAGIKKGVVVANFYKPGKVLLFGWYRPPPAPDVFDDGQPMTSPGRQPVQPKSNVHGDFYVDYSHGIRLVGPVALLNGQPVETVSVYQHPALSRLVSNEGPLRVPRYPSPVPPAPSRLAPVTGPGIAARLPPLRWVRTTPSVLQHSLDVLDAQRRGL